MTPTKTTWVRGTADQTLRHHISTAEEQEVAGHTNAALGWWEAATKHVTPDSPEWSTVMNGLARCGGQTQPLTGEFNHGL